MAPVRVVVHLEANPDSPTGITWWAESPDVSGFTAAAPSLPELVRRTEAALSEVVGTTSPPEYRLSPDGSERPAAAGWDESLPSLHQEPEHPGRTAGPPFRATSRDDVLLTT